MLEIITHSPLCVNVFRLAGILLDLLSQTSDMYIHRSYVSRILIAPYKYSTRFSLLYTLLGFMHEKFQNIELLCCQIDLAASNA